jgi:hypothetical protein
MKTQITLSEHPPEQYQFPQVYRGDLVAIKLNGAWYPALVASIQGESENTRLNRLAFFTGVIFCHNSLFGNLDPSQVRKLEPGSKIELVVTEDEE